MRAGKPLRPTHRLRRAIGVGRVQEFLREHNKRRVKQLTNSRLFGRCSFNRLIDTLWCIKQKR